jgi:hypothetical protein
MNAPSDRDLIQRARRGDGQAFGELVRRYQTSVFNVCYRILHERLNTFDEERVADADQSPRCAKANWWDQAI